MPGLEWGASRMAPMRQQPTHHDSLSEPDARRLVRVLANGQRSGVERSAASGREAILRRTVEDQVIPRLLMARCPQRLVRAAQVADRPMAEHVPVLTGLAMNGTQAETVAYVEALRDGDVPTESLLLDLLTPSARLLGRMWEDDSCTFSDVTIGLVRLGNVLRLLGPAAQGDDEVLPAAPRALLVQMPGEQHGFGLAMVVQFFRRAGWNVRQAAVLTGADLLSIVKQDWFGIIGISVACSDRLETLAANIREIRRISRNRAIGVMVGGPPFLAHPQLAGMIGADATATDGRQAVRQAQSLLSLRANER